MKILQTIKSGKLLPIDEYFSLTNDFFCKISYNFLPIIELKI